jgi:polar amino acid transport system substrate-binding protein
MITLFGFIGCTQKETENESKNEVKSEVKNETKDEISKIEQIKKAGKIVIGTSAYYPPYEFHKIVDGKDEIMGFDIEIAKAIADEIGVELEIKDMDFKGLIPALKTGKIDFIIAGMTPTEERMKEVDFSKVYYKAVQTLLIKSEDVDKYKTLQDFSGAKVGVQKTSIQEKIAGEKMPNAKLNSLSKVSDLVLSLKSKKVDTVLVESPVAKAYTDKYEDIVIADIEVSNEDAGSAIAIQKGNEDLLEVMNKVLDELMKNNKIDEFVAEANELVEE